MQNNITIVDSIMGSGKTTWAINHILANKEQSFIYITPFLNECERIKMSTSPDRDFKTPVKKWPKLSKLENIRYLIQSGEDIAASHELFKRFDGDIKYLLKQDSKYTLIIDEVLDVITPYNITKDDIKILKSSNAISIDDNGVCHWNEEMNDYNGRYEDVRLVASSGNLVCVDNTFFIWRYNPEIFQLFDNTYIMTYLFDGSIMKGYFDYYGIKYNKVTLREGNLVPYEPFDTSAIKGLINIYQGKLNLGFQKSALSKSWYEDNENKKEVAQIGRNLDNYFKNILKAKAHTKLWTCFESDKETIERARYRNDYIPCNTRATNDYAETFNLAYLVNIYINPGIIHYLAQKNIIVDKDQYALAMLLQWIWRSRIRNGFSINIYLPSERMRKLLEDWISNNDKSSLG